MSRTIWAVVIGQCSAVASGSGQFPLVLFSLRRKAGFSPGLRLSSSSEPCSPPKTNHMSLQEEATDRFVSCVAQSYFTDSYMTLLKDIFINYYTSDLEQPVIANEASHLPHAFPEGHKAQMHIDSHLSWWLIPSQALGSQCLGCLICKRVWASSDP